MTTGKFPTPERDDVYEWILDAFDKVRADSIVKTFAHIGYISEAEAEAEEAEAEAEAGDVEDDLASEIIIDPAKLTTALAEELEHRLEISELQEPYEF